MIEANNSQIEQFKKKYCKSNDSRLSINKYFTVAVESYEELLPENTVRSYATGNREINRGFVVFKVMDEANDIIYYPVFCERIGGELVKAWGLKMPRKMTVFSNVRNSGKNNSGGTGSVSIQRKEENQKMLQLIQFARSMMILHVTEPEPMRDPFRGIYDKLEKHPRYNVWESDIKSVNTAIVRFLNKPVNIMNENFKTLQQYITYLQRRYPHLYLKDSDFDILRDKMLAKYPNETIVF